MDEVSEQRYSLNYVYLENIVYHRPISAEKVNFHNLLVEFDQICLLP